MTEPEVSVRIDPAMRALWRARRRAGDRAAPAAPSPRRTTPAPPASVPRAAAPRPADGRVALRRDGARPLAFIGAPALRTERRDAETGARFEIALYLAADGGAAAALAMRPPADGPAREIHLAEPVAAPDDLDRLLDRLDPVAALPSPLSLPPERAADVSTAAAALSAAYARFRAGLGGAAGAHALWRTTP